MINDYLTEKNLEVGTVLKATYEDGIEYYIVGRVFIYCNDYNFPQIRPHKFIFDDHISIASEEEKKRFIEDLKRNHLIWDEEAGSLNREYDKVRLSVVLEVTPNMDINELIERLNVEVNNPTGVFNMKFENF